MRRYEDLKAFTLADELALAVYKHTQSYPADERFGLTAQIRRAAVSVPSNIVEGASKDTQKDFLRFLHNANGSLHEFNYQLSLGHRLGYSTAKDYEALSGTASEEIKVLGGLIRSLR